ncbi:MAG: hypothetical protein WCH39_04090 [Schlesneria sp.]
MSLGRPTLAISAAKSADGDYPIRLFAAGFVVLIVATWPLWIPQSVFPQVPLVLVASDVPRSAEWGLLVTLLISLLSAVFVQREEIRRLACVFVGLTTLSLVMIDQHRFQPWAWQFVILSFVFALADDSTVKICWRWLVISIYAWSAWSKMDQGFVDGHGRFLLDGLFRSVGFIKGIETYPEAVIRYLTAVIPLFELLVAIGLCWNRTRFLAVIGAAIIHTALLLALGPFGHRHQPGVLIWNFFFLIQNGILFLRTSSSQPFSPTNSIGSPIQFGNRLASLLVVSAIIWPSLESFGLCDHWPAWAVYAAKPERVTVFVHSDDLSKLPESLRQYLGHQLVIDDSHPLRIDRWSLDALYVPIYPQDRFQVGVALSLARQFDLNQIQVVVEGPADRWTGKRAIQRYVGIEPLNTLSNSYRCNAQPKMGRF